jgi:hypothetical protein
LEALPLIFPGCWILYQKDMNITTALIIPEKAVRNIRLYPRFFHVIRCLIW